MVRFAAILTGALATMPWAAGQAVAERPAPVGIWLTDQGDGTVEIKECGHELCGTVYSIIRLPDPSRSPLDARNEQAELRSRPLCGMPVMGGLRKVGPKKWSEGWVYDPHAGKTYAAEVTLEEPNLLSVYGYIGVRLIGRTVAWTRADAQLTKCAPPR